MESSGSLVGSVSYDEFANFLISSLESIVATVLIKKIAREAYEWFLENFRPNPNLISISHAIQDHCAGIHDLSLKLLE